LSLCFNRASRHEDVLGSGGIAPLILWPRSSSPWPSAIPTELSRLLFSCQRSS